MLIHEMFTRQAWRTPDAVALVGQHRTYTYTELDTLTNHLAMQLRGGGIRPESVVGCWARDSVSTVIEILSVLKAGGAYLLLDPNLPIERVRYMVDDTDPACILTDAAIPATVVGARPTLFVDHRCDHRMGEHLAGPVRAVRPDNLAYVAYTSGSTGRPKGVLITHAGVTNHATAFRDLFDLRPGDRLPLMAPAAFDMATEEILPPLIAGCTLIDAGHRMPSMEQFTDDVCIKEYTILNIPAPLWHQWTTQLETTGTSIPPSLRVVIVGSDKIYASRLQAWKNLPGAERVWWVAAYGVTEAAVTSLLYSSASAEDLIDEALVPIGAPLRNVTAHVVRDDGEPASEGEVGELYLGGVGVARGYQNLPTLTAQRFVADPSGSRFQSRCYRTGDLVRRRGDGCIVWVGRKDAQIKINGLRIEPAEVEAQIQEFPTVGEAVVVFASPPVAGDAGHLTAYVQGRDRRDVDTDALTAFLATHLHPLMVPREIIVVDRIPLNSNGKIDRTALLPPAPAGAP